MPRKLNTSSLTVGQGGTPSGVQLQGAGVGGVTPHVGQVEGAKPTISEAGWLAHVKDGQAAHKASAVAHDGQPGTIISSNVEGALDELIGVVPPEPPKVGEWKVGTTLTGIPDWGVLKLADRDLVESGMIPDRENLAENVFPYYHVDPSPALDTEFTSKGSDPRTDHLWNSGFLATVPGTGGGQAHVGAFTRGGDTGPAPKTVIRTTRLLNRSTAVDPETGKPFRQAVTISGVVFPADRGVLALLHFPAPTGAGFMTDFTGQALLDRCIAAVSLGGGILGDRCTGSAPCDEPHICDGDPGGIFGLGTVGGKYDPYAFPGRATGQYDLKEIHLGLDGLLNQSLPPPWIDLDVDGVPGAARAQTTSIPAAGQVRLGTDPTAGITAVSWGIPILGGTIDAYKAPQPTSQLGSLSEPIVGHTLLRDSNFFRYRLPVLENYASLKWTPRGENPVDTMETFRFFETAQPASTVLEDGSPVVGTTLSTAGNYGNAFDQDYWVWQVARYRHTFLMPGTKATGLREEAGTYWLVHFRTERDFEKCVRDGIPPWDPTDGYETYSVGPSDESDIHATGNQVNEYTSFAPQAPSGRAPDYGYAAPSCHALRPAVMLDPNGITLPAVTTATWNWATAATPAVPGVMWCSGVAYFTPRVGTTGASSFVVDDLDVVVAAGFWKAAYRTDDSILTGDSTAPALLSSPSPMFLGMSPFAYGPNPNPAAGGLSATVPVNTNPATGLTGSVRDLRLRHVEIPYTHMGSNAGGVFTGANGPLDADTVAVSLPGGAVVTMLGDDDDPSFTVDARLRAFFRRPLGHTSYTRAVLPHSATDGHGTGLTATTAGTILYHSTRFDATNKDGIFGNFVVGGAAPYTVHSELFVPAKDVKERFLDETCRYVSGFGSIVGTGTYDAAAVVALHGPGLGTWAGGPIEVPVRAGLAEAPWRDAAWLRNGWHLVAVTGAIPGVAAPLQVAGLPHRNPLLFESVAVPFPSAGVLVYPKRNFAAGHVPVSPTHMTNPQPDYSAAAGIREYIRVLDVAFSHWAVPGGPTLPGVRTDAVGQTTCVLKIDGVVFSDFAFTAPGPGRLEDDAVSIAVKVPGLTTWMDVGRVDGAGPSKQDPNMDGAGCAVAGSETYNFLDPVTGHRGCYVKVHVGPVAALFAAGGVLSVYTTGSPQGEVPIMIRVSMREGAYKYDLQYAMAGGAFDPAPSIGASPGNVRGLFGISVVHPNELRYVPASVPGGAGGGGGGGGFQVP